MTTVGDPLYELGGIPVGGLGRGRVFRVIKTNEARYNDFMEHAQGAYPDGVPFVFPASPTAGNVAIQAALDACVEGRNDFVVLEPSDSDYDISAVINLNKKAIHLICPAGLGYDVGSTNACRIHPTASAAIFAVSDSAIEIAGLFLKQYADKSQITIAAGAYALNIHHNFFQLNWSAAPEPSVACAGDGGAWGEVVHHCLFESSGGDDVTCAVLVNILSGATGARCDHNEIFMGDGNICTIGISNAATKGMVNDNKFMTAGADGSFGHCIALGSYGVAIGNRGTVPDSILVTGGAAGTSLSDNMNGASGGLIDEA